MAGAAVRGKVPPKPWWLWLWLGGVALWQVEMSLAVRSAVAIILLGMAAWCDLRHLLRLFYGIRWFLVSLVLLFGWLTPGTAILPYAVVLMPTVEGLWWAAEHLLLLIGLIAWLVIWFWWVPLAAQAETLVRALAWLPHWVPRERFAVRLVLVLAELQTLSEAKLALTDWRQLAQWLAGDDHPTEVQR